MWLIKLMLLVIFLERCGVPANFQYYYFTPPTFLYFFNFFYIFVHVILLAKAQFTFPDFWWSLWHAFTTPLLTWMQCQFEKPVFWSIFLPRAIYSMFYQTHFNRCHNLIVASWPDKSVCTLDPHWRRELEADLGLDMDAKADLGGRG